MQPKTKTHEAYEYLERYQGLTNPDNLRFIRWLRDAKSLLKTNAIDAYVLQGFAHMALGDADLAVQSLKKAHLLNHDLASYNYAVALHRIGNFAQSHEVCLGLLKKDPYNHKVIAVAIGNAGRQSDIGMLDEIFDLLDGSLACRQDAKQFINKVLDNLKQANISRENFARINQLVVKFLTKRYFGNSHIETTVTQTEIGNMLDVNIYLNNVSIDDCLRWNDAFLDVLIDDDKLHFDDYKNILVHFIPKGA
ncbi:hypothetical protein ACFBZI_08690 [Moraxella sp. ZJ142]|uniref:hypothetical protein n=1 Tax=Moraxella marmotae TaxID=3344520 RepID=UPI0035D40177